MKQIPDEVKAGVALLDEKVPGWRGVVSPETLNMKWCGSCVLGQLFGDYHTGLVELGILEYENQELDGETEERVISLGFHAKKHAWEKLTQTWQKALSESSSPVAAE